MAKFFGYKNNSMEDAMKNHNKDKPGPGVDNLTDHSAFIFFQKWVDTVCI